MIGLFRKLRAKIYKHKKVKSTRKSDNVDYDLTFAVILDDANGSHELGVFRMVIHDDSLYDAKNSLNDHVRRKIRTEVIDAEFRES